MSTKSNGKNKKEPVKRASSASSKKLTTKKFEKVLSDFHFNDIVMDEFSIRAKLPEDYFEEKINIRSKYILTKGQYEEEYQAWPFYLDITMISDDDKEESAKFFVKSRYCLIVCCHTEELTKLIKEDDEDLRDFLEYSGTYQAWIKLTSFIQSALSQMNIPALRFPRIPPPTKGASFTLSVKDPFHWECQ